MGDGWETARRLDRPAILLPDEKGHLKVPGNEWCVLKLGVPGKVQKVVVSTTHFKGNFPESCKVEACAARASSAGGSLGADQIGLDGDECEALGEWFDLVPRVKLTADADHTFAPSSSSRTITHVRLTMYVCKHDPGRRLKMLCAIQPSGSSIVGSPRLLVFWVRSLESKASRHLWASFGISL